jgi:hypothetical protein
MPRPRREAANHLVRFASTMQNHSEPPPALLLDGTRADGARRARHAPQTSPTNSAAAFSCSTLAWLLSERERLNKDLQQIIDEQTEPWGIKVTTVEIKDVGIPSTMQRAMARQAEAERERRAKIIHAEGEAQAAGKLSEAAAVLSRAPAAIQLRYLQTLSEIGSEQNSTIIFPIPLDLLRPLLEASEKAAPAEQAPADGELPQGARPGELPAGVAELPEPVKTRRRRAPS